MTADEAGVLRPARTAGVTGSHWHTDTRGQIIRLLSDGEDILTTGTAELVADALHGAGLIVLGGYYVPTDEQLYDAYNTLGHAYLHNRIRVRWVMCTEILRTLVARHQGYRFSRMPDLGSIFQPAAVDSALPQQGWVLSQHADGLWWLFDVPVRVDPAARWPMFEVNPDG